MKLLFIFIIILCFVLSCYASKEDQKNEKDAEKEVKRSRCPVLDVEEYQLALSLLERTLPVPSKERSKIVSKIYKKISQFKFSRAEVHDPYLGRKEVRLTIDDKIILPKEEIDECVKSFYRSSKGDGAKKLLHTLSESYYGIGERTIQRVLNSMEEHRQVNPRFDNVAPEKPVTANNVMERHQIDLVDLRNIPVTIDKIQYNYVLSVLDVFSRFLWLRPIKDKAAGTVAMELYSLYMEFGSPRVLQSDQGSEFKGVVKTLCARLNTRLIYSRSNHPQSQGKDERSHQTWKQKLRRDIMKTEVCDWVTGLPLLQRIYNEGHHTSLNMSPYECFFGIKPNHKTHTYSNNEEIEEDTIDLEEETDTSNVTITDEQFQTHLKILQEIRENAKAKSDQVAEKTTNRKLKKNPPSRYIQGDKVFVKRIRKDERVNRGGKPVKGPSVFEGTVVESNFNSHRYKIRITDETGKQKENWYSVNMITSKRHKDEKQKKMSAKVFPSRPVKTTYNRQQFKRSTIEQLQLLIQESIKESKKGITQLNLLLSNAERYGLELHAENEGNGNCMFMALSDQLLTHGISISHEDLRTRLTDYLRQNPTLQSEDSVIDLRDFVYGNNNGWGRHLDEMSNTGTWGDNIVLIAASNFLNARIVIVSSLENADSVVIEPINRESTIELYLGHLHELHYVSLMQSSDDDTCITEDCLCDICGMATRSIRSHVCNKSRDLRTFTFPLDDEEKQHLHTKIEEVVSQNISSAGTSTQNRTWLLAKNHTSMVWTSYLALKQVQFEEEMVNPEFFYRVPSSYMDIYDIFRQKLSEIMCGLFLIYATRSVQRWMREINSNIEEEIQRWLLPSMYLITQRAKDSLNEWITTNEENFVETAEEMDDED